jgi:aryl-alcohol dehydrogenase-like predicted oxidoreductase
MRYVNLGNTGIKISNISFGAWAIGGWMWGGSDDYKAVKAMEKSFDLGMTTIDTAPAYGFGKSEELVGKVIKGRRNKFQVLTKYGLRWDTELGVFFFDSEDENGRKVKMHRYAKKESIINECEHSLKRLNTDYIDLYQIHWPDDSTPIEDTMEGISRLLEQGKIVAAGVCNYSVEQLKEADKYIPILTDQVAYSMVKRDIEKDIIPFCLGADKGILAYSPLQRGLLTGKINSNYHFNPGDSRPLTPFYKEPNLTRINEFLDKLRPIASLYNSTIGQLVIQWTLRRPAILSVLVGARDEIQVEENINASELNLEENHVDIINNLLENLVLDMNI